MMDVGICLLLAVLLRTKRAVPSFVFWQLPVSWKLGKAADAAVRPAHHAMHGVILPVQVSLLCSIGNS